MANMHYNDGEKKGTIKVRIQKDCFSLYTMVAGEYAAKHNLEYSEVYKLFKEKQVYAKIVAQNEYLNSSDFSYVLEYVEEILKEDDLTLYHGTTADFRKIDFSKSRERLDFGKGFYTTVLANQAELWGKRQAERERSKYFYVYQYSLRTNADIKMKHFDKCNYEWLEMVKQNRMLGGIQHDYDIVFGPVADDNAIRTVQLYMENLISAQDALARLEYSHITNQVSFHTQKGLDCLWFTGKERYETND